MKIMRGAFRTAGLAAILIALPLLLSCGGSGGAGSSFTGGGIGGTGIVSQGPITAKGSIFVNGVEFQTTSASITVDGDGNATEGNLKVGMVVTVNGRMDKKKWVADTVEYQNNVEGPIDSVDPQNNQLVVMGQTIFVDRLTEFDPIISTLNSGAIVEVSGLVDDAGTIHATRVELKTNITKYQVTGSIKAESIDTVKTMFAINGLMVNYRMIDPGEMPTLKDNLYVEVSGSTYDPDGTFVATEVVLGDDTIGATDSEHAEIEGFVTSISPNNYFTVSGQQVHNGTNTVVAVGNKVEVEGTLVGGILMADSVLILLIQ